mgnify:CR=1 FL=1
MALRDKDIKQIISMIMIGIGSYLLAADIQEAIRTKFGVSGSVILGVIILLTAGYLFKLG